MHENDPVFYRKIILIDEAHFYLGGTENPRVIVEKPLYLQRVTVWCDFWSGEVIGPLFSENEAGATVTVNGLSYREMINDFLWPKLDSIDLDNARFRHEVPTYLFVISDFSNFQSKMFLKDMFFFNLGL